MVFLIDVSEDSYGSVVLVGVNSMNKIFGLVARTSRGKTSRVDRSRDNRSTYTKNRQGLHFLQTSRRQSRPYIGSQEALCTQLTRSGLPGGRGVVVWGRVCGSESEGPVESLASWQLGEGDFRCIGATRPKLGRNPRQSWCQTKAQLMCR
jgi:hypothetical protein